MIAVNPDQHPNRHFTTAHELARFFLHYVDGIGHVTLDRDAVQRLASMYKVSRLAIYFRLVNLGLLPPDVAPSAEG